MAKHSKPKWIVAKLRQADVLISQSQSAGDAIHALGASSVTSYLWRSGLSCTNFILGPPRGGRSVQLKTILRDTITSEIVHRWPDPFGEKLDPMRGELLAKFLRGCERCIRVEIR